MSTASVETERLPDFAGGEDCAVLQRSVVAALNITRAPIARPPANHIRWWRHALWFALACAAGGVDALDLCVR